MTTVWDKIYQDYQKGGRAWATLKEEIHPAFLSFIKKTDFDSKCVLDIGCGTGKYLEFLSELGFDCYGIDNSPTAVEMSKKRLGTKARVEQAEMFEYEVPQDKFDLIISVSTIHHGSKEQVKELIRQIYRKLLKNGHVFITVPDYESSKKWDTFQKHKEISPGTYAPQSGPEKGLPHSFFTKKEVAEMFCDFTIVQMNFDEIGRWILIGKKVNS